MGAACTGCSGRDSYDEAFSQFYLRLKIRQTEPKDWFEMTKTKINRLVISEKNWINILNKQISADEESIEITKNIFLKVIDNSSKNAKQYLCILSFLFLCKKNSQNTKKEFERIYQVFKFGGEFVEVDSINYMKKELFYEFIFFYLDFISFISIEELSSSSRSPNDFKDTMNKVFDQKIQKAYVDQELMANVKYENVKGGEQQWINLDKFFNEQYFILVDDSKVRQRLSYWFNNISYKSESKK
jgi:hypothetical protein